MLSYSTIFIQRVSQPTNVQKYYIARAQTRFALLPERITLQERAKTGEYIYSEY